MQGVPGPTKTRSTMAENPETKKTKKTLLCIILWFRAQVVCREQLRSRLMDEELGWMLRHTSSGFI